MVQYFPYTGDSCTCDLIGSWRAVVSQAIVSRTLISHMCNVMNGNPFDTLKAPKLAKEMEEN